MSELRANRGDTQEPRALPPRLAESILGVFLAARDRDEILGDMAENYARRTRRGGRMRASLWYWRQAIVVPSRLTWRRRATFFSVQEFRYVVRGLRGNPGFTAVALLSLAIGIGANTALFSVVRSLLLTTLPVDAPEELTLVYYERPHGTGISQYGASGGQDPVTGARVHSNLSYAIYLALREVAGDAAEVLGFNFVHQVSVVVDEMPAIAAGGLMASGDYFSTLRLPMTLGRPLGTADDRPDAPRVAVISHTFWQRAFGANPNVVSRSVRINGEPFRVVGVTDAAFSGLSPGGFFPPTEVTVPLAAQPVIAPRWTPATGSLFASDDRYWVRMIARLPDEAPREALREAMTAALRAALVETSMIDAEDAGEVHVRFLPGAQGLDGLRRDTRQPLAILALVVSAVLLIVCVNLASLLLARGAARQREFAVRRALGASRLRLIRQLLLESLVLAFAGGAGGLLVALWSGPALTAALTAGMGRVAVHFALDWTLLGVAAAVSTAAAILCGLLPALRVTRKGADTQLTARGGSSARFSSGRVLIAVQIAISVPLLVGAGLFLRTLGNLNAIDPGFDAANLVVFKLDASLVTPDPDRAATIYRQVIADLEEVPGVIGATLLENALVSGWVSNTSVRIDGERAMMHMNAVGPRYFETLRIDMLSGRPILESDGPGSARVMVVNATAERDLFSGRALGRTVTVDGTDYAVVGVAADSKYESLRDETPPTFFDSYQQRVTAGLHVVLRTATAVNRLEPTLREIVARADSGLPATDLRTQSAQIQTTLSRERIFARLLVLFGGFALLIACVGLYGVTSFAVTRRRPEIGVRLALGARPDQILWLVVRQVFALTAAGLAVGSLGALLLGPIIGSMLYGLGATDGATFAGAAVVMLGVALTAGWIPALRAARTDALISLSTD